MNHEYYRKIYAEEPERYDALVSHEDYRGKLLPAIEDVAPLNGRTVAEFGAGTGRLTRLLTLRAKYVFAADLSLPMLRLAKKRLQETGTENWCRFSADHRSLPLPSHSVDITVAGWTFGSFVDEKPKDWMNSLNSALAEAKRIMKPGGRCIILETLGTGQRRPAPPNENLANYYNWLENEHGFTKRWIRTDYQFKNPTEAWMHIRFFFGDTIADRVSEHKSAIVPECTGLWWKSW